MTKNSFTLKSFLFSGCACSSLIFILSAKQLMMQYSKKYTDIRFIIWLKAFGRMIMVLVQLSARLFSLGSPIFYETNCSDPGSTVLIWSFSLKLLSRLLYGALLSRANLVSCLEMRSVLYSDIIPGDDAKSLSIALGLLPF